MVGGGSGIKSGCRKGSKFGNIFPAFVALSITSEVHTLKLRLAKIRQERPVSEWTPAELNRVLDDRDALLRRSSSPSLSVGKK